MIETLFFIIGVMILIVVSNIMTANKRKNLKKEQKYNRLFKTTDMRNSIYGCIKMD